MSTKLVKKELIPNIEEKGVIQLIPNIEEIETISAGPHLTLQSGIPALSNQVFHMCLRC